MTTSADAQTDALRNALWRTSSYTASNGNCVEVAEITAPRLIAVRDTKDRSLPAARVRPAAWSAFTHAAKTGAFDQPFIG